EGLLWEFDPATGVLTAVRDPDAAYGGPQQIEFVEVGPLTYDQRGVNLDAYATSGLPITFTSDNTAVARITGSNRLEITGIGTVNITAKQAGDDDWDPKEVIQTITINK